MGNIAAKLGGASTEVMMMVMMMAAVTLMTAKQNKKGRRKEVARGWGGETPLLLLPACRGLKEKHLVDLRSLNSP